MMASKIEIEPTDRHGEGRVCAHGDEKEGAVFKMSIVMGCDEDCEAGYGYGNGDQGEEKSMFEEIGEIGDYEGEDEGGGPGWDGVELGADLSVAVASDDTGREECITVGLHPKSASNLITNSCMSFYLEQ